MTLRMNVLLVSAVLCGTACNNAGDPYAGLPDGNLTVHVDAAPSPDSAVASDSPAQEAALVRIDPESPGANCPAGGYAVLSGLDANGNGTLENSEIQSTSYICNTPNPTTIEGSVVINNSVDADKLIGVTMITGSLTINAQGLENLDLSSLVVVGGNFVADAYSGDLLAAPALTMVGGNVLIDQLDGDTVGNVSFPELASIGGNLAIGVTQGCCRFDAPPLTSAAFPSLVTVTGAVIISKADLATLTLPALTSVGADIQLGGETLTNFSAPLLATISGSLYFEGGLAGATETVALPQLTTIGADVAFEFEGNPPNIDVQAPRLATIVGSFQLNSNSSITSIALPGLTSIGNLDIENSQALTTLSLPALATASGSIALKTNPAITHFDLPALTEVDGTFTVGDPCCGSTGNSSLTVINVPLLALVKGTFAVANNSVLNSVVAPSLTEIDGGFAVQQNPDLSDCAMIALAAQTNVADPQIYQNLNDVSSCS